MDGMSSSSDRLNTFFSKGVQASQQFAVAFTVAITAVTAAAIHFGNEVQTLNNKVLSFSKNQGEANTKFTELVDLANRTRSPIDAVISGYQRLDMTNKQLGITGAETSRMLETINKGLQVSGATTGEASAAMLQLSQAYASGRLQGDEFRSLSETFPMFMLAIQQATGKTTAELKQMGSDGLITRDVMKQALDGMQTTVDEKFGQMSTTIGQATTVLWNNLIESLKKLNDQTGVFDNIAKAISKVTESLPAFFDGMLKIVDVFSQNQILIALVAAAIVGALVPSITLATLSFGAFLVTIAPYSAAAAGIVLATAALRVAWDNDFIGMKTTIIDFSTKFTDTFNEMKITASSYGTFFSNFLTEHRAYIEPIWQSFLNILATYATDIWNKISFIPKTALDFGLTLIRSTMKLLRGEWQDALSDMWTFCKTMWGNIYTTFFEGGGKIVGAIIDMIGKILAPMKTWVEEALGLGTGFIDNIIQGIQNGIGRAMEVAGSAARSISSAFQNAIGSAGSFLGFSSGGIVPYFADGGIVQRFASGGLARGTDTVPAMLTPGEVILNASQQKNLASQLGGGSGSSLTININTMIGDDEYVEKLGAQILRQLSFSTAF